MNKKKYTLPSSCPNCGAKIRFVGNKFIACKECAWMDDLNYYKNEKENKRPN
jgi:RNase P subunit RPR2